jgi:hypothetical protein
MLTKLWDPATARILSTALIFALAFAFLYEAQETLTLLLFAILFAYLVEPLVSRLELPLRRRIKAIAAVYLIPRCFTCRHRLPGGSSNCRRRQVARSTPSESPNERVFGSPSCAS